LGKTAEWPNEEDCARKQKMAKMMTMHEIGRTSRIYDFTHHQIGNQQVRRCQAGMKQNNEVEDEA
jgi:hypothetical protein